MSKLQLQIESLLFAAQTPLKVLEIKPILEKITAQEISAKTIEKWIQKSIEKYSSNNYPFTIVRLADGYQFLTKSSYQDTVGVLIQLRSKKRLSKSALETLAIIAYKQPITKGEIEQIRGVSADYAVQKLLEKELVTIKGKSEAIGRPILYGTTSKFLAHLGINSLRDLPLPKEFSKEENVIGQENE